MFKKILFSIIILCKLQPFSFSQTPITSLEHLKTGITGRDLFLTS